MLKKIIISLFLATAIHAQSFTNTVDTTVQNTRIFNEVVTAPNSELVDTPLTVWFSYSGNPSELTATLSHRGTSVKLFEDFTPSSSPVVITQVGDFVGISKQGPWVLNVTTGTGFVLNQWGVIPSVPEPSVYALFGLGLTSLFAFYKKNR
jgi:hypothetical protein